MPTPPAPGAIPSNRPARRSASRPPPPPGKRPPPRTGEPANHALGRSRGGFSTKVHLAVETRRKPLAAVLTPGQAADSPQFVPVLTCIRVPRRRGRPRPRPTRVLADKAYSARANRAYLRRRGIKA